MDNEHVFQPSWDSQDQELGNHKWTTTFLKTKRQMENALHQRTLALWQNTSSPNESPLCELFRRLYTLRNQLLHGGATYRGRVNRRQVEDGAQIMAWLMPCFIGVMIDHPEAGWGIPRYPVRPDPFLAGRVRLVNP